MTTLEQAYRRRHELALSPLAKAIEQQLGEYLQGKPHIDRISARAKSVDRFLAKATKHEKGGPKYSEPLEQIQDQVGARIITFYAHDVVWISEIIERYFRPIEVKDRFVESEWQFGYFGKHYVLLVPSSIIDSNIDAELVPRFFELQVKTLFQHAWSEANHDLGYKPGEISLSGDAERKLAFSSAQAWGADMIFDGLSRGQKH